MVSVEYKCRFVSTSAAPTYYESDLVKLAEEYVLESTETGESDAAGMSNSRGSVRMEYAPAGALPVEARWAISHYGRVVVMVNDDLAFRAWAG